MRARVWSWTQDPAHEVKGLIAENATGEAIGMAHYRPFARPLSASTGGFLDDLFVAPEARGTGAAEALIAALKDLGHARGWTVIRWITAEDNYRARGLYDRLVAAGMTAHVIGGADVAAELDAKRAIDQGARLAARL